MFKSTADIIIFLASGGTAAFGNMLLKAGMNKVGNFSLDLSTLVKMVTNWQILLGFFLYGFSSILYLKVLTAGEVTKSYPLIVSYMFVLLLILGAIFLRESLTATKLAGISVILIGIFLASR